MTEHCLVCESTDIEVRGEYRGTHPTFKGLRRAHCRSCGMVFAIPMPNDKLLDEYNARYFASAHGGQPRTLVAKAFFSAIARVRLAHLERYLGKHVIDVSSVMEFGPGPGFFASK